MVLNTVTTESQDLVFAVIHHGGVDLRCSVSDFVDGQKYDGLKQDLVNTFRIQSSTELIRKMDRFFPECITGYGISLWIDVAAD